MIVAIMIGLGLGYSVAHSCSTGAMTSSGFAAYEANNLVGTQVKNPAGEMLGTITDFVIDSKGRIAFAILTREFLSEYIAVPFSALSLKPGENIFVLNTTLDELESAPAFSRTAIMDNRWAEDAYRYFGQQPYWTEEGTAPAEGQIPEGNEAYPF
jgi:hypothetical protein